MPDRLSITSPTDLLHAVPFLLGFHPTASIVVISLQDSADQHRRVGLTIRLDYPEHQDLDAIAERLVDHLIDDGAVAAMAVVYGDEAVDRQTDPLIETLAAVLNEHGLALLEGVAVSGDRWRSLLDPESNVQSVPDFSSSLVAAEHVLHGAALPLADERALRSTLAPRESDLARDLAGACARRRDVVNRESILEGDGQRMRTIRRLHIQQGADAIDRVYRTWIDSADLTEVDLQDLATMVIGMHDVHVRDYAMGMHSDEQLSAALALWRTLLPITPSGSIAPVATVLAAVAFETGDGALAQRAIDRAFDDRQGYPMASLLRQAMEAGWAPSAMTSMRKELRAAVVATVRAA